MLGHILVREWQSERQDKGRNEEGNGNPEEEASIKSMKYRGLVSDQKTHFE